MKNKYPYNLQYLRANSFFCFCFFILVWTNQSYSQVTISTPILNFTQICADASYNAKAPFKVSFSFSPISGVNGNNQFVIELSDSNGNFSTPTILVTSIAGAIKTSPASLNFAIPINLAGEKFKIRVKSTHPATVSPESVSFSAYYQVQNTPFSINNFAGTASYCKGSFYTLKIDNPGTGTNDSPLKYPSLTYRWYKEATPAPLFLGNDTSLLVNSPGTYYVETNYGSCSSTSYSNRVVVREIINQTISITSSNGNPFCMSEGLTTLSTQSANSYQWYLKDVRIEGATSRTYVTDKPGLYEVKVDLGTCVSNAIINLQELNFSSTINVAAVSMIAKGEMQKVITTTTATNPSYKWYVDGNLIVGGSSPNYETDNEGDYKVVITQNSGCIASNEFKFTIKKSLPVTPPVTPPVAIDVINLPNIVSPNGDGINDTWIIPQEYTSGTNTELIIVSSSGQQVLKTKDYQNNWPENKIDFKNVNPVYYYIITTQDNYVKKGSITIIK